MKLNDIRLIDLPKISDPEGRGNLSIIEKNIIPFTIKRVYYLYDVPSDATRGGHAHKELLQCLVALSGSFDIVVHDGEREQIIHLNKPNKALLIPKGIWRSIENFSSGSVCLAVVSEEYLEEDYIRDFDEFLRFKQS